MKILFIANCVFYGGGAQSYIREISNELKQKNHKIFYLSINNKDSCFKNPNHFHLVKFDSNYNRYISRCFINIPFIIAALSVIRKIKPNIIYLQNTHHMNLSILIALYLSKIPTIQMAHDYGVLSCPSLKGNGSFGSLCEKPLSLKCIKHIESKKYIPELLNYKLSKVLSNRFLKLMLVPTHDLEIWLKNSGVKNLYYLPMFSPILNPKLKVINSKNTNKFVFVGRLSKEKGVDYIIRAFKVLKQKGFTIKLTLIGEGEELENLKKLSLKLGLEKQIDFRGQIPNNKLDKYYNSALAVLTPSVWRENACLTALEAMQHARPVIATKRGAFPEYIIDGKTGYLAKAESQYSLAEKMQVLLENPELATELGNNARDLIKIKYSRKKHVSKLESILRQFAV